MTSRSVLASGLTIGALYAKLRLVRGPRLFKAWLTRTMGAILPIIPGKASCYVLEARGPKDAHLAAEYAPGAPGYRDRT